jgi:hypothetical protein
MLLLIANVFLPHASSISIPTIMQSQQSEVSISQCLSPSNFRHLPTTNIDPLSPPTNKQQTMNTQKTEEKKTNKQNKMTVECFSFQLNMSL